MRGWRGAVTSGVVHGALLTALLVHGRVPVPAVVRPGTVQGSRLTLTYQPGKSAAGAVVKQAAAVPVRERVTRAVALPVQRIAAAGQGTPGAASGGDSLGNGNVTVALPNYFPWPRPDLGEMARGSKGDVIVEVTIDANGRIVESRLAQGLGAAIDANVMATIQGWTFKPATKDGVAIASEQELLFHYERG